MIASPYPKGGAYFPLLVVMLKGTLATGVPSKLPSCQLNRQGVQPEYVENVPDREYQEQVQGSNSPSSSYTPSLAPMSMLPRRSLATTLCDATSLNDNTPNRKSKDVHVSSKMNAGAAHSAAL